MKVAISTDYGNVSAHFGRCVSYSIFQIEDGNILKREEIPNPGHQPGFLPKFLSEKGVQCIIAGGMGPRAQSLFSQKDIETIIGVQGSVDDVIQKFRDQKLEAGTDLCDHGNEEGEDHTHECQHDSSVLPNLHPVKNKICVPSLRDDLGAEMDPTFGRASYFLIFDPATQDVEVFKNPNKEALQGAGIKAAQLIASKNVNTVLTGSCGPKATRILQAAGIQIKSGLSGRVKDVLSEYKMEAK